MFLGVASVSEQWLHRSLVHSDFRTFDLAAVSLQGLTA